MEGIVASQGQMAREIRIKGLSLYIKAFVDLRDDDRFLREAGFHELARIGEFLGYARNEGFVVEGGEALEEFGVGKTNIGQAGIGLAWVGQFGIGLAGFRHRRDLEQEMEVVVHQTVGSDPAAGKFLVHAHQGAEFLLFLGPKHKAPVDDA